MTPAYFLKLPPQVLATLSCARASFPSVAEVSLFTLVSSDHIWMARTHFFLQYWNQRKKGCFLKRSLFQRHEIPSHCKQKLKHSTVKRQAGPKQTHGYEADNCKGLPSWSLFQPVLSWNHFMCRGCRMVIGELAGQWHNLTELVELEYRLLFSMPESHAQSPSCLPLFSSLASNQGLFFWFSLLKSQRTRTWGSPR